MTKVLDISFIKWKAFVLLNEYSDDRCYFKSVAVTQEPFNSKIIDDLIKLKDFYKIFKPEKSVLFLFVSISEG